MDLEALVERNDENETRELIEGELNAGQMLLEESRDYFDNFPEAS